MFVTHSHHLCCTLRHRGCPPTAPACPPRAPGPSASALSPCYSVSLSHRAERYETSVERLLWLRPRLVNSRRMLNQRSLSRRRSATSVATSRPSDGGPCQHTGQHARSAREACAARARARSSGCVLLPSPSASKHPSIRTTRPLACCAFRCHVRDLRHEPPQGARERARRAGQRRQGAPAAAVVRRGRAGPRVAHCSHGQAHVHAAWGAGQAGAGARAWLPCPAFLGASWQG